MNVLKTHRTIKAWLFGQALEERPELDPRLRKASHDVSNETMRLRGKLNRLSRAEDVVLEGLLKAMREEHG